jgi:hypothetical protein
MDHRETSNRRLPMRRAAAVDQTGTAPDALATPRRAPIASFLAHLLGQPGQRRGRLAGAPALTAARGVYLSTEFAGETDRRPTPGLIKVRDI